MRARLIAGVASTIAVLALAAAPAGAALLRDTPVWTQSFTNPGAVTVEASGPLQYKFVWYADKTGSGSSNIYGYFPDHSSAGVQTTISRSYTDTEGEIGKVSGIAFDQIHSMLYVADTEKNRILEYPRTNGTLPADQVDYGNVGQMPGPVSDSGAAAGSGDGEFDGLAGITAYVDGFNNVKVYAADKNNARIQVFDSTASGLAFDQSIPMPGGNTPRDVAVDPATGNIYVAMVSGGPEIIQVFDSAGAPIGQYGNAIDGGTYDQIDYDPDKQVVYASKAARVDVINPESMKILGSYMFTAFSEAGPGGDRMVKFMSLDGGTGQIFVARFDPSGVLNGGSGPEDPTPAQSYLTPNPPTCSAITAPSAEVGDNTIDIVPDCTDADNSTIQEFSVVGVSRGSAVPAGDFNSIEYTAPSSGAGLVTLDYRVRTIDGISNVYHQNIYVTDSSQTIATELFPGRPLMSENFAGIAYNEGVGGIAKYLWFAQSDGNQSFLFGYDQTVNAGPPSVVVDCSPSSAAGELGGNITGIAFLPNQSLLLVADADNGRIVVFPRNDSEPDAVDCDGATSYYSIGGHTISEAGGIAVNNAATEAYIAVGTSSNPNRGIIRFNPTNGNLIGFLDYSGAGPFRIGSLAFAKGRLFAAVQGTGLIEVFEPDFTTDTDIGPLDGSSSGDFISISAEPNTNRLWAMKSDELDVFSLTTGTRLGRVNGTYWGNQNISVSAVESTQNLAVSSGDAPPLRDFFANPNPICTPGAPIDVQVGKTVSFTPSCTDTDNSSVREFSIVNSGAIGSAAPTGNRAALTYTAGGNAGSDSVSYRVNTQDGMSVTKSQAINVTSPTVADEKPVIRETTNLQLDSGDVYVKLPGSNEFVKLTKDMLVPVGTVIDARDGKAHITMANKDGTTYDGVFWEGIFQVLQGSGNFPITTMKLRDDLVGKANASSVVKTSAFGREFTAHVARKRGKKRNGLWGDAKGRYRTTGKGGSATVRGTRWYVANYTYGSLFKVSRGVVTIDPIRGKNFNLKAGKQFFIFYKR